MAADSYSERPLFGGAISSTFSHRFQDVSNIRQVPDHQEVFVDPARDESLIFELLDYKHEVGDEGSAIWFLQDLATEQEAEGGMVIEQSGVIEAPGLCYRNLPAVVTTAVGQMAISKGRQGREAQNIVKVYLANLRLKEVGTDVLITAYDPIVINPLSESARAVGAGFVVPATQAGCMPMVEAISKGRQGREAQNIVKVYLANLRLKEVGTDVLITAYDPIVINPLSESARVVGAGFVVPATQAGCMPMAEVFKLAVSSFKVNDWSLFGSAG